MYKHLKSELEINEHVFGIRKAYFTLILLLRKYNAITLI